MKERILLYKLAQHLSVEELKKVSGAIHRTSGPTTSASGGSPGTMDVGMDVNWDF